MEVFVGFLVNAVLALIVIVLAAVISYGIITRFLSRKPMPIKIVDDFEQVNRWPAPCVPRSRRRSRSRRWSRSRPYTSFSDPYYYLPEPDMQLIDSDASPEPSIASTVAIDFESSTVKAAKDSEASAVLRYCKEEQIWDYIEMRFVNSTVGQDFWRRPDDDQLRYWFKVFSRRRTTRIDEKPSLHIQIMAKHLIDFLRTVMGGLAFKENVFMPLSYLYPFQNIFDDWIKRLDPVTICGLERTRKQELVREVGMIDNFYAFAPDDILSQDLGTLYCQLQQLVQCLAKEFEPLRQELETHLAHGQISFELLPLTVRKGMKLVFEEEETKDKLAVQIDDVGIPANSGYYRDPTHLTIHGSCYAWQGEGYTRLSISRTVPVFEGTMQVAALPWKNLTTDDEKELTDRGKVYCQYSGIHHVYNNGPLGGKGRAILDIDDLYDGDWGDWGNLYPAPLRSRTPRRRPDPPLRAPYRYAYDYDELNDYRRETPVEVEKEEIKKSLSEDELYLLPPTVTGFMLKDKRWVSMRVLALSPVEFDEHIWDQLVLAEDTKSLIRNLVDTTMKPSTEDLLVQDLISGKGGGMIALLHGKPGTGKTLTAEAVAEYLRKPLYVVGSAEIPRYPEDIERHLKTIVERAKRWNAVLLLDEADELVQSRGRFRRAYANNATVTVALRVLEYHASVVFLTTNRVKDFDQAVLSRFSIGINFPELSKESRFKIWSNFLKRANMEIVDDENSIGTIQSKVHVREIEDLASKNFNGRVIKNVVRTAQTLALGRNEPLEPSHINNVVGTCERFLQDVKPSRSRTTEVDESEEDSD